MATRAPSPPRSRSPAKDAGQNVTLTTTDGGSFKVPKAIAEKFETVKHMIEDIGGLDAIPLPSVTTKSLQKAIDYATYYHEHPLPPVDEKAAKDAREAPIPEWDQNFAKMPQSDLFELILAANYLDYKALLDLTCKTVANMIKGKSPEQIRAEFNIKNDFTPEEEEEIRRSNEWCEEK